MYQKRDEAYVMTNLLSSNFDKAEQHDFRVRARESIHQTHQSIVAKVSEAMYTLKNMKHLGDSLVMIPQTMKNDHHVDQVSAKKLEKKRLKQKLQKQHSKGLFFGKILFFGALLGLTFGTMYTAWNQ